MKIGILTQWYPPEPGPASLPGELAEELVRRGHVVQVVTGFPNYPDGQVHHGYRIHRRTDEIVSGVRVRRVALYPSHDARALGRMANYASFGASALASGIDCLLDCDAVWVSNSPPTVAATMHRLERAGVPLILHVLDLWPDNLLSSRMAAGGARGQILTRIAQMLTRSTYECADQILAISPGVVALLQSRGISREKLAFAPLWANESLFRPTSGAHIRAEMGVDDSRIVILYAGAIGATQDLDTLIAALSSLPAKTTKRVECWVLGDGVGEGNLRYLVSEMPSTAPMVRLLGRRPMAEMPAWIAAADLCYVGLRPDRHARFTLPSKVQTTMAMAKPVLASVPGDVDQLVRLHHLGFSSGGDGSAALAAQISAAAALGRDQLGLLGAHAREVYTEQFSLAAGVDRIESSLNRVAGVAPVTGGGCPEMVVRPALRSDIPAIVDVHARSFPGFFLTFLGPSFLRLFYEGLRHYPDAQILVAVRKGDIVGFAGGVLDESEFFSRLKHDKTFSFARSAIRSAVNNPRVMRRLWRARRRDIEAAENEIRATLLSIAVDPETQGSGIGRELLDAFREWLAGAGASRFKLTTDAQDNAATISFYEHSGMTRARQFRTPEGRSMLELVGSSTFPMSTAAEIEPVPAVES